jgi:small subunit ribosomal protein S9
MSADEDDREIAEPGGEGPADGEGQADTSAEAQQDAKAAEAQPEATNEQPGATPEEQPAGSGPESSETAAEEHRETPGAQPSEVTRAETAGEPTRSAQEPEAGAPPEEDGGEEDEPTPRAKPTVPGAHLEVDIVPEGADPLGDGDEYSDLYAIEEVEREQPEEGEEQEQAGTLAEPIATAAIDLAAGARYRATGKRKTAVARVTLRPGSGVWMINGRALEVHFPRLTLQRNIRQPLETVGYQERMDVIARLGGGGISAQAGALRHGVSRALLEADPNLRGELKRRGFLTRDSRVKERKKAGLKKARKRPQFSKR